MLAAITDARWPTLVELDVWLGSSVHGGDVTIDDVVPLFDGRTLPRLRHLGLQNAEITDQLVEALAAAPIARQLESLDLSLGTLSDAGVELLSTQRGSFPSLRRLIVDENYLSDTGLETLATLGWEVRALEQKEEDPGDPGGRYCSVWE